MVTRCLGRARGGWPVLERAGAELRRDECLRTRCNAPALPSSSSTSGGRQRSYRLFVPQSYDGRTPLPLVLDLHGSGGTSAGQAGTSRFEALAAREGFAVATLQAGAEGNRWNVPMTDGRPDDVQYVSDVIDHVAARVCTDSTRVYATGFSGGARMSSLLACKLNYARRGHRADGGPALAGPV